MYDLSSYRQLSHTNRSFNMDQPVDDQTFNTLVNYIDEFLSASPFAKKLILTDQTYIKTLSNAAIAFPRFEAMQRNSQILAPLVISVYCTQPYDNNWIHIGRLYSKLALFAIEQGYHIGFCNGVQYSYLRQLFTTEQFPFECRQHTFLSIGNKLNDDAPHNWSHTTNALIKSYKKSTDEFIQLLN